jgi:uncharacterized membrane protein YjdF
MKTKAKKIFNAKNLMRFVFFTFIATSCYVTVRIIIAPSAPSTPYITDRVKSDYVLMLLANLFGASAMLLPGFLSRKFNLSIPSVMMIVYAVFLYCGIYLGDVRNFYYTVPHWDTILHIFSGAALGALGFSIVSLLNKPGSSTCCLSPGFVALFAFCFAMMLGVLWEIFEFSTDYFLGRNMQKHTLENGEPLIGQAALMDTMKDLIVDAIGAFVMSAAGYISLKHNKGWLEKLQVNRNL